MTSNNSIDQELLDQSVAVAPGAVAPTGGAVPRQGKAASPRIEAGAEEIIDALGLLRRALRDLDPQRSDAEIPVVEAECEQAITALQRFEGSPSGAFKARVRALAESTRADLLATTRRTLSTIRSSIPTR
ncbi:MAG: hypothetical protein QM756_44470 [Polyangiaceae bacterium]